MAGGTTSPSLADLVRENLTALVSAFLFLYLVIKLLVVAHFDIDTGYGLLAYGSTGEVLIALAASSLYALLGFLLLGVMWWLIHSGAQGRDLGRRRPLLVLLVVTVPVLVLLPIGVAIGIVGLLAWATISQLRPPSGRDRKVEANRMRRPLAWLLAAQCTVTLLTGWSDDPWLASERLFRTNAEPETVYVVGTDGDDLIVLEHSDHKLARVPLSDITGRVFCSEHRRRSGGWYLRAVYSLFLDPPDYPTCRDLN